MATETVDSFQIDVKANIKPFEKDLKRAQDQAKELGDLVSNALEKALSGSHNIESIFKGLALDMSKSFFKAGIAPLQQIVSGQVQSMAMGMFSALTPGVSGAMGAIPKPKPFAKGGIVNSPTYFPMASGTGLMGEAGAEAILPLSRGSNGQLGVQMASGGERPLTIVMNITTPDAQSFAKSHNQMAIKLARAVGRGRRGL